MKGSWPRCHQKVNSDLSVLSALPTALPKYFDKGSSNSLRPTPLLSDDQSFSACARDASDLFLNGSLP